MAEEWERVGVKYGFRNFVMLQRVRQVSLGLEAGGRGEFYARGVPREHIDEMRRIGWMALWATQYPDDAHDMWIVVDEI